MVIGAARVIGQWLRVIGYASLVSGCASLATRHWSLVIDAEG
jgi:hypothetical protein